MDNNRISILYQIIGYYWNEQSKGYEPEIIFESTSFMFTQSKYDELVISDDCPLLEITQKIVYQDDYTETKRIKSKD